MRNINRLITVMIILLAVIAALSGTVSAQSDELPPPPAPPADPDSTPASSGGGGGGGGGSSYSPSVFKPYTEPVKSSDGTVIGAIDVQYYDKVYLRASGNSTLNNLSYNVSISEGLDNAPQSPVMDIVFWVDDSASLPEGMNDVIELLSLNITRSGKYGWGLKPDTVKMTFAVPMAVLENQTNESRHYLVCYDGKSYYIVPALVAYGNDTAYFTASPRSDCGAFTLLASLPEVPVATPTPTPAPTLPPAPTATPMPSPDSTTGIYTNLVAWVVIFIAGIFVGIVILVVGMKLRP